MHNYHPKIKALAFFLALSLPIGLTLTAPPQLEAKDAKASTIEKQDTREKTKALSKKLKEKSKDTKNQKAKEPPEAKKVVASPTPPPPLPPVTPNKKKYASPSGYQVMTDGSVVNFRSMGVIYMHGYKYTYYSSKVLYHYKTPEWYACDDHIYRTADGYIVVASGSHAMGAIVPTPFGKGKVLDHCHINGVIDIYVDF